MTNNEKPKNILRLRSNQKESGQSFVELAMTLVFVLILLAGLVDLSRAFFVYMALRDASQEGAVFGSIDPDNVAGIRNRVRDTANFPIDLSGLSDADIAITYGGGGACASNDGSNGITIKVSYDDFILTTPFLGTILGSQIFTIEAEVTDTILRPPC